MNLQLLLHQGLAVALAAVRDRAAKLLDPYRTHAGRQRTLREASAVLARASTMNELVVVLARALRDMVAPEGIAFYAVDNGRLRHVVTHRLETSPFSSPDECGGRIAAALHREKDAIAVDHRAASAPEGHARNRLYGEMRVNQWAVVLPLLADNALVGAIALGPKLSGDPFCREDVDLLLTLANQAGVALKNAARYGERARAAPTERPPVLIDLRVPVAEAVEVMSPTFTEKGVRILLSLPDETIPVSGDQEGLRQLVLDLLLNAYEATPPDGAVMAEVRRQSSLAVLTVTDTGEGIPGELLDRIFEPFVTTKSCGIGLGLAVSAGMASMHGGTLRAANVGAGGAEFTLSLPLASARETRYSVMSRYPTPGSVRR